mgnify:CR=1 FL=1
MITIVDKVSYLPNATTIPTRMINDACKMAVQEIRKKANQVDSKGKKVMIVITGSAKTHGRLNINLMGCDDDPELRQRIEKALGLK